MLVKTQKICHTCDFYDYFHRSKGTLEREKKYNIVINILNRKETSAKSACQKRQNTRRNRLVSYQRIQNKKTQFLSVLI